MMTWYALFVLRLSTEKNTKTSGRYFINIQIENQLKNVLERVTVASRLHNSNTKTDDNMRHTVYLYTLYTIWNLCCKSNSVTSVIILALTLFELCSAQELLNCDIQANGFFFSKVICYGKPSVEFINVLEKCTVISTLCHYQTADLEK